MSLKFVILGSGSSMGVPRADGYSGDCDLRNKKNFRTRCSALIKFNDQNILIDTSPDLRSQLLENKIKFLDIPVIIDYALKNMQLIKNNSLKSILACDQQTREQVSDYIKNKWK